MLFKRLVCLLLSLIMLLVVTGCGEETTETKKKKKKVVVVVSSQNEEETDTEEGLFEEELFEEDYIRRELPEEEETTSKVQQLKPEYTLSTKTWAGPKGYSIIVPRDDARALEVAEILKTYFKKHCDVELKISTDKSSETEKEILIGDTNRKASDNKLKENEFSVELNGSKLVFNGGHWLSVQKAVKTFSALKYQSGKVNTFVGSFDFSSTKKGGYTYVWGDEFDGNTLDLTKWRHRPHMAGTNLMKISTDSDVVNVSNGLLNINAIRYYNPLEPMYQYAVTMGISTHETFAYQYGFLEMYGRIPFQQGAWPGFWLTQNQTLKPFVGKQYEYYTEVDIFEVFASRDSLATNIHKWYKTFDADGVQQSDGSVQYNQYVKNNETDMAKNTTYTFKDFENLSNEYHLYGFEWTPTEMSMYIDGEKYFTYDLTKNFDDEEHNTNMDGFQRPLSIMFNNHLYVADYVHTTDKNKLNDTDLPTHYCVDYIRLYQKSNGNMYFE